jgi:YfiH family protein
MMDFMEMVPQPNEPFHWVECAAGPALQCRPLAAHASHLFTTRAWRLGAGEVREQSAAWKEVEDAIGIVSGRLVRVRQVHGNRAVRAAHAAAGYIEADILVADDPTYAIAVQAADCVPLLIADRRTGAAAAAHAGWRGLAQGVPAVTVATLVREYGSRPDDLLAAIGPSIGPCCYEVGSDVRDRFEQGGFEPNRTARWFLSQPRSSDRNPSMPGIRSHLGSGHWVLDCWTATRDQLVDAGVWPGRIFTAELCTASHPDVLCSYRRDGAPAGRLAAVIRADRRGP